MSIQTQENELNEPPQIRTTHFPSDGSGVIDDATFVAIEIDRLFDAVNHSQTLTGQSFLYRSLTNPLTDMESVSNKQQAVKELRTRPDLRTKIETLVDHAAAGEGNFFTLLTGTFIGMLGNTHHEHEHEGYGYAAYRKGTRFMLDLVEDACAIDRPDSEYLVQTLAQFRSFADSQAHQLMTGPVYKTEQGMLTKAEKSPWTPGFIFRPTLFKPLLILIFFASIAMLYHFAPLSPGISFAVLPSLLFFSLPLVVVYIPGVGTFDRDSCIYPLRDLFKKSADVQTTLEALGKLDELLSFVRYGESFAADSVLPELLDSEHHSMHLQAAKNPILAREDPSYVPNNVDLDTERLTFISGPNSGGKTAFCKTVAQIQLLTQIGCPVPAQQAQTTIADKIFYQVPEYSTLNAGEGRFGTELKRTRDIFLSSSAASLVILDELSEGTTYEEKLETSENILDGFRRKMNTTVLITHNHELVDKFNQQAMGQTLQVEFRGGEPTYKLVEGISRVSHADRVAKNIGFSKQDIDDHLSGR